MLPRGTPADAAATMVASGRWATCSARAGREPSSSSTPPILTGDDPGAEVVPPRDRASGPTGRAGEARPDAGSVGEPSCGRSRCSTIRAEVSAM